VFFLKKILEDIRVMDLTHAWFGPYCTMLLAELGAEVIKIEPPWGSLGRMGPGAMVQGASVSFYALNINKKDITINLKEPKGLEIFKKLVPLSDVVIQNFRPGVMERLGLGYDVLKSLNPRIIYAALSGFGQTGPYSPRASFAGVAQAISGYARQVGDQIDPEGPPLGMGGAIGDLVPALFTALSIIAAIRYRDKTGKGQMIDSAQADDMTHFNTVAILGYSLTGLLPWEMRRKYTVPGRISGHIRVKNGWIQVSGFRPRGIESLKKMLGLEELTREDVVKFVVGKTRWDAVKILADMGIAVGPVYSAKEVVDDPHLIARDMFVEIEHPKAGKMTVTNFPVKFSESAAEITSPPPLMGQHNKEVLMDLLGYSEEQVEQLEKEGVISTERTN